VGVCLRGVLLDHAEVLFLLFGGTSILFSIVVVVCRKATDFLYPATWLNVFMMSRSFLVEFLVF
jgi:NADH:ubiquinone oxidoreductase subunit 6 (subunit J)